MSAAKKKKSVVRSSTEIFEHLWNGATASSVSTQSEFVEQELCILMSILFLFLEGRSKKIVNIQFEKICYESVAEDHD